MSEKLLQMKDVTMQFDDTTLFTDFNLDLDYNETVGITGPSGSGKSTILRIAVNLLTPTRGSVLYKEKRILDYDPRWLRQKMILVPQESSMFPGTVRENLLWGLSIHNRTATEEELLSVLEEVNLNIDCLDVVAANLSGGEKQRLSISRALLLQPDALLLDEPTSSLDEKSTLSVEKTIQSIIAERNIGVLIVTHNPEQARRFTDRVVEIEMRGGE
ncbi:MAG: ABC transporter ATP-binding protein [Candidatus Thorarchaeota archaeon]|jgi:putative ABC transport system ATP-binding protein